MTELHPNPILCSLFSTPATTAIFSDFTRTQHYLTFESALAKAQAELEIIPQEAAGAIDKHCDASLFDFDELKRDTEQIGYPVLPVVRQLVKKVNEATGEEKLGEWAHWGATTQDVTDTATVLQLLSVLDLIQISLTSIINTLSTLVNRYKSTPLAARSNLQHAVPITYGFKLARLLSTFLTHHQDLTRIRSEINLLQFSGAAGTLATLPPTPSHPHLGLEVQSLLAQHLNLRVPLISWHTDRIPIASFTTSLSLLTSTCTKFALDLKLQSQSEVAEVAEPFMPHRGSSSTMPQKRNPIGCVYITAMNALIRNLNNAIIEDVAGQDHERSTGPWEIEWSALPQVCMLSHGVVEQTRGILEGVEVNEMQMERNLRITGEGVVSENVMMMLGRRGMGRQRAHDVVYELCRRVSLDREKGVNEKGLVELLMENKDVRRLGVKEDELREWCDVTKYLGYSEVMVERVLKECEEQMRK